MTLDRRSLVFAAAATVAAAPAGQAKSVGEHGLFWKATAPGKAPCTLFGYARMAAAAAPGVVTDGTAFIAQCDRVITDGPNLDIQGPTASRVQLSPISNRIPAYLAARIHALFEGRLVEGLEPAQLSAVEVMFLLTAEGEASTTPQIGVAIAEPALTAGKPLSYLLSADEYLSGRELVDLPALNRRMDGDMVAYLFALRDKVGPIGRYEQGLYAERRIGDLAKLRSEMKSRGVVSSTEALGLHSETIVALRAQRTHETVQNATKTAFVILPVGALTEEDGILTKLRKAGVEIAMMA